MRVLIVTPEYPPDHGGGIITYYRDLVPALQDKGCEITVLKGSAYTHGEPSYEHGGVPVLVLETARFEHWLQRFSHFAMFSQLRMHLAAAFALHEQIREGEGFDVVEVVDWGMLYLPWILSSMAPYLIQFHGSNGQIARKEPYAGREAEEALTVLLERESIPAAPALCSYSTGNAAWWKAFVNRDVRYILPSLNIGILVTGQESERERNGWLTIGRVQHWKGPQVACAAWKILGERAPTLQWYGRSTVHGESGELTSDWLRRQYPEIWGKRIVHHRPILPDAVTRLMAEAKVVLIPSLWDTFNLVVAEAMAHGCVVVVSDAAGAADLIEHGENGFIFPSANPEALAALIQEIEALSAERMRSIGSSAATTVAQKMAPSPIAEQKIELYRSLELPTVDNSWLRQILLPSNVSTRKETMGFLDHLPLKALSKYALRRAVAKIFRSSKSSIHD